MRKKIRIQSSKDVNSATDAWMQHLVQRLIIGQLEIPYEIQARLVYIQLDKPQKPKDDQASSE